MAFLSGCFIKAMKLGIFKSLGVLFTPLQEYFQVTHTVLGTWMAMFAVAVEVYGKSCGFYFLFEF